MSNTRVDAYRQRDPRDRVGAPMRAFTQSLANGEERDATLGGSSASLVPHSLGRAYRGAIVVGLNPAGGGVQIDVEHPDRAAEDGVDVTKYISLSADGVFTGTVRLWIY